MVMGKDKGHFSGGGCTALVSTMWVANCFIHPSASDPRFTHPCQTMNPFQHDLKMCSSGTFFSNFFAYLSHLFLYRLEGGCFGFIHQTILRVKGQKVSFSTT